MHLVRVWKFDVLIVLILFGALVSFSSQTQASQQSSDSKQNQSVQKVTLKFLRLEKVQDSYNEQIVAFFKLANLTSHPFRYETEAAQPVRPVHEMLYHSWLVGKITYFILTTQAGGNMNSNQGNQLKSRSGLNFTTITGHSGLPFMVITTIRLFGLSARPLNIGSANDQTNDGSTYEESI